MQLNGGGLVAGSPEGFGDDEAVHVAHMASEAGLAIEDHVRERRQDGGAELRARAAAADLDGARALEHYDCPTVNLRLVAKTAHVEACSGLGGANRAYTFSLSDI